MSGDHNQYQKARSIEDALQALTDIHQEMEKPREDIIRMAREAAHQNIQADFLQYVVELERFAKLVAAAEQDRILRIVYEESTAYGKTGECMWIGVKHKVGKK